MLVLSARKTTTHVLLWEISWNDKLKIEVANLSTTAIENIWYTIWKFYHFSNLRWSTYLFICNDIIWDKTCTIVKNILRINKFIFFFVNIIFFLSTNKSGIHLIFFVGKSSLQWPSIKITSRLLQIFFHLFHLYNRKITILQKISREYHVNRSIRSLTEKFLYLPVGVCVKKNNT